jgi:hypothetical protein
MGPSNALAIVLLLLLVSALPTWPHSASWGYGPSGALGVIFVVVLAQLVSTRL